MGDGQITGSRISREMAKSKGRAFHGRWPNSVISPKSADHSKASFHGKSADRSIAPFHGNRISQHGVIGPAVPVHLLDPDRPVLDRRCQRNTHVKKQNPMNVVFSIGSN